MKTANVPVYGNIEVYENIALSVPSASVYREEINKCILAITKILIDPHNRDCKCSNSTKV